MEGIVSVSFCYCYGSWKNVKSLISSSIRTQNLLLLLFEILFLHRAHLQSYSESPPGIYHYYITCQLSASVLSLLCHMGIPVCLFSSTKTVLSCVGCFKDTTVTLLQIERQDPRQYGGISQGGVCVTWNCENLGKERDGEKWRGEKRREEPLDWPLETDTVKSQPWHFN